MRKVTLNRLCLSVCGCVSILGIALAGCSGTTGSTSSSAPTFQVPTTQPGITQTTQTATISAASTLSAVPSVQNVAPGGKFDVAIRVNTSVPSRAFQCIVRWDPSKAQMAGAEIGGFFKDFAASNELQVQSMPSTMAADNKIGKFPPKEDPQGLTTYAQAIFLTGGSEAPDKTYPGPKGSGDIYILHMTAAFNASGQIDFKISAAGLSDNSENMKSVNLKVVDGQITVSGPN